MSAAFDPWKVIRPNLGPLKRYLDDGGVSEIMLNPDGYIYIERNGLLELVGGQLEPASALHLVHGITRPLSLSCSSENPIANAHLPDGSRVSIVTAPICSGGAAINIRKFLPQFLTTDALLAAGTVTQQVLDILQDYCGRNKNILIAGVPGVGKTSCVNALSPLLGERVRVIVIEDTAELQLHQRHFLRLVTRPERRNEKGEVVEREVTMRDLLKQSLRMRPDRIIVGEARGAEALDFLQALNTGTGGSLGTIHSETAESTLQRLETMIQQAGLRIERDAIRSLIGWNIHLIVHMRRCPTTGLRYVDELLDVSSAPRGYRTKSLYRRDVN